MFSSESLLLDDMMLITREALQHWNWIERRGVYSNDYCMIKIIFYLLSYCTDKRSTYITSAIFNPLHTLTCNLHCGSLYVSLLQVRPLEHLKYLRALIKKTYLAQCNGYSNTSCDKHLLKFLLMARMVMYHHHVIQGTSEVNLHNERHQ